MYIYAYICIYMHMWADIPRTQTRSLLISSQGLINGKPHEDVVLTLPLLLWLLERGSSRGWHSEVLNVRLLMRGASSWGSGGGAKKHQDQEGFQYPWAVFSQVCSTRRRSNNLQQKKTMKLVNFNIFLIQENTGLALHTGFVIAIACTMLTLTYTWPFFRNALKAGHARISSMNGGAPKCRELEMNCCQPNRTNSCLLARLFSCNQDQAECSALWTAQVWVCSQHTSSLGVQFGTIFLLFMPLIPMSKSS